MLRRVVRESFASSLVLLALLQLGCAESDSCSTDRECPALHYCGSGRCQQDCTLNAQCGAGGLCTSTGRCATAADDAGLRDDAALVLDAASVPDAAMSSELDAAMLVTADAFTSEDAPRPDAFVPDSSVPLDAHTPADASVPIDAFVPIDAGTDAFVPPDASGGPLRPSTYTYTRIAVGGLGDAHVVAFHPDGSYAIVLERSNGVHVYDWASGTATRFDLRVAGRAVTLDDLVFSADGSTAWIVGWERVGTTDTGVIITLSDAAYRRGDGALSFTRSSATTAGERITGIEIPRAPSGGPGGGHPIVLSQSGTSPYIARLRELDPATSTFTGLFVARSTGAGCDDLAFSDNEFGQWGIVLACGTNGADIYLYTEVAGVGEWRLAPGGYGNVSRTDGHPSADYALIVNWSSRYVHRHESGALRTSSASPGLVDGIWDVSFSPDGRLALITGRARGRVAARHDLRVPPRSLQRRRVHRREHRGLRHRALPRDELDVPQRQCVPPRLRRRPRRGRQHVCGDGHGDRVRAHRRRALQVRRGLGAPDRHDAERDGPVARATQGAC